MIKTVAREEERQSDGEQIEPNNVTANLSVIDKHMLNSFTLHTRLTTQSK